MKRATLSIAAALMLLLALSPTSAYAYFNTSDMAGTYTTAGGWAAIVVSPDGRIVGAWEENGRSFVGSYLVYEAIPGGGYMASYDRGDVVGHRNPYGGSVIALKPGVRGQVQLFYWIDGAIQTGTLTKVSNSWR
jgi:hypothetical protein